MLDKIAPGTRVKVKVVKHPTNAAAAKTITRLLSKDKAVMAENDRLRDARAKHFRTKRRGGRDWSIRVVKQHPISGKVGEEGTIRATLDALTDLRSVQRFIEVTKA